MIGDLDKIMTRIDGVVTCQARADRPSQCKAWVQWGQKALWQLPLVELHELGRRSRPARIAGADRSEAPASRFSALMAISRPKTSPE